MLEITSEYTFNHSLDHTINPLDYELHNHYSSYEIFIFLRGEAEFVVEGAVYPLNPYDIVLLNPNEFHHIFHHSKCEYERVVLQIKNAFFTKNNCDEYRQMFDSRKIGTQNIIPASFTKENNIVEIISRIEKYSKEKNSNVVVNCAIVELLYVLNKYRHSTTLSSNNLKITPIIMYINENITSPLSINKIAEKFFLNKYYLCRIFKKYTGLTINKYITYKRIVIVRNLYKEGKTLSQASIEAGFGNYSNFYKMYLKETGKAPREDMRDI